MAIQPLEIDAPLQRRLDRLGLEFQVDFLSAQISRQPDHVSSLVDLGHVLTQLGRYREGLRIDLRLSELLPDEPTVHYNLACSQALVGDLDRAFAALERSIQLGYDDLDFLRDDEDLAPLRQDPRFEALLTRLETC
ncbi:MAG: TPR end-of-group domain-containing protein [Planctomycetota bacterium]|jgi:tetratricopeptide (TPR) repeat protein